MKIKQYGPEMEKLKKDGKTYREIAAAVGLKYEQVKGYFKRDRREQRVPSSIMRKFIYKPGRNLSAQGRATCP